MRTILVGALLIACGSSPRVAPGPRGYAEHMAAADRHEARADDEYRAARSTPVDPTATYQCGDRVLADQAMSGGAPLTPAMPCWDTAEESTSHHRFEANRERRLAHEHRIAAANLVDAERLACRGMPAQELEHSPFSHAKEIEQVVPHTDAGKVIGARIIFKPVLGLDAAWMRQAIACHRARFERMGEPPTYFPEDPTLVAGAEVRVEDHRDHIEVVVTAKGDVEQHVALARAKDLVSPQTATR